MARPVQTQDVAKGTDLSAPSKHCRKLIGHEINRRRRAGLDSKVLLRAVEEMASTNPANIGVALRD
jgi:hypothetical protein